MEDSFDTVCDGLKEIKSNLEALKDNTQSGDLKFSREILDEFTRRYKRWQSKIADAFTGK